MGFLEMLWQRFGILENLHWRCFKWYHLQSWGSSSILIMFTLVWFSRRVGVRVGVRVRVRVIP
jgi:hypothetical protein